MIPIGTTVRWRPDIAAGGPIGTITGYPKPRMADIDGRGWLVSVGLLEAVGMTEQPSDPLVAVIEMQVEALDDLRAELKEATDEIEGLREYPETVIDLMEGYLSARCGQRRPLRIDDPDLAALARVVFEGVE